MKQKILIALALTAALSTVARADTPPDAPQSILQMQLMRLKKDTAVILNPRVTNCSSPGLVDRAIVPDVREVCVVEAKVLITPSKP